MKPIVAILLFFVLVPFSYGDTLYRLTPLEKFHEGGQKWFRNGDEKIHAKYVGEVKNGRPHGQGIEEVLFGEHKGQKYIGEFKDGKAHGAGTFIHANGDMYVGQWRDDNIHGHGIWQYTDGEYSWKYIGHFKDNKKEGWGREMMVFLSSGPEKLKVPAEYFQEYVGEWYDDEFWSGIWFGFGKPSGTYSDGKECRKCEPTVEQLAQAEKVRAFYPWVEISRHGGGGAYIDPTTYRKSGAYTYIWILFNAGSQEVEGLGRSWTQYLEIDCNRLGWRNVEFRSYFQPMANGATGFKISKPQEKWQYAEPNKQWSMLLPKLCDLD